MKHRLAVRRPWNFLLAGTAVLVPACSPLTSTEQTSNRFAAINIAARATSAGRASANATVIFFDAISTVVPNSSLQQTDQCTFASVDTVTGVTRGVNKAGTTVGLTVGTTTLLLPFEANLLRYANPQSAPFPYVSGDLAQVTIPDAGEVFPGSTISVRLAEPLSPAPVVLPIAGQPLAVAWNAVGDSTSAIILQLRYPNPASSPFANEQIICSLKDDGRYDVPAGGLTAMLAAPSNRRLMQLTRWRTNELRIDARTLLHMASSIDTTVVFP